MLQRSAKHPQQRLSLGRRLLRDRVLLLFALPGVALIVAFHYVPLLGNVIAFKDYQPFLGIGGSDWSGWANFSVIFNGDPAFLRALKNTLILTSLQSIFVFPAPILLALLLNSLFSERIKRIAQSILYLPHFMSWVIVVALFQQMLGGSGLLNNYLRSHDLSTIDIIGNSELFHVLLTSQIIWKDTGWATILFLAALSQIDSQLYEAASVDGASVSVKPGGQVTWFAVPDGGDPRTMAGLVTPVTSGRVAHRVGAKTATTTLTWSGPSGPARLFVAMPHQVAGLPEGVACDLGTFPSVHGTLRVCRGEALTWSAPVRPVTTDLDLSGLSDREREQLSAQVRKDVAGVH